MRGVPPLGIHVFPPLSFCPLPGGIGEEEARAAAAGAASPVDTEEVDTEDGEREEVNLMQPPARAKKKAKKGKKRGGAGNEEPSDDYNSEVRHKQTSERRQYVRYACMRSSPLDRHRHLMR